MSPPPSGGRRADRRAAAVVVDHAAGPVLHDCLASLIGEDAHPLVVVDNASGSRASGSRASVPGSADDENRLPAVVTVVRPGRNLGFGAGANRGVAATSDLPRWQAEAGPVRDDDGAGPAAPYVLVSNPDVSVRPGALARLVAALVANPSAAVAGPRVLQPDGQRYPSARSFPSVVDAAGHALLGPLRPDNRFSRRYRMDDLPSEGITAVDWVSGACFLVRRQAWEELGGFDEGYFMYAEDMDLCWRAGRAGWQVLYVPAAVVTHVQGVTTRRRPYRMLVAHHRSALRFAVRSASGWRRLWLPAVAAGLGVRLVVEWARLARRDR